nr:LysR substrate-binding domain-containing protein [Leifsonia psychrotolerans]
MRQLAYFVGIAEAGSISDAAARLHVSASALSAALTDLEASVGMQLCIRRKAHGVTLTPNGVDVLDKARRVLRAADEIRHTHGSPAGELRGPITLGCYVTLAPTVVPALLEATSAVHPGLTFTLVESAQDGLLRGLFDGDIDLAVVYDMHLPGGLNRVLLYEVRLHVLLPAGHRLCPPTGVDAPADAPGTDAPAEAGVDLADLIDEPFVLFDAAPSREYTLGLLEARGLHPEVAHRTSSYEMVRALVARGQGWSVLVQRPAQPFSYEGRPVVSLPISPAAPLVGVYLVWPEDVTLTPRAQAVVDCARDVPWPARAEERRSEMTGRES